ncbi:sensor histidine kinase [Bosea sp. R86505]|uniref:sensor histidine kinase n=1 Tax=Bosea sp. R86505 TaxID=3101710 RepID=UPI00366B205C
MRLARFPTVRGRLLALLVAIALPIAGLTAVAALTTYHTVIAAIELAQSRTADDFAVRTRVWHRGSQRVLLASGSLIAQGGMAGENCAAAIRATLLRIHGYQAARFILADGRTCFASVDPALGEAEVAAVAADQATLPLSPSRTKIPLPPSRFDQVKIGGVERLVTQVRMDSDAALREALLLADPDLLDQVFELGDAGEGVNVALVSRGESVIMHRPEPATDDLSWLPEADSFPTENRRWEARSRSGQMRSYAARLVTAPDLYVVASFGNAPERAARMQFLALLIAPILTLILLCLVYLRAIDRHCIHWLRGIESAARARSTEPQVRAVIAPEMPSDIRSVAEAFNTMVDEQEVRQRRLQTALDDNRFLVRELHHRVKNSLQVVQSYIGLTKRDYRDEARLALADAETRVHVLSAAYRFTLADGEMQPVRVDLFVEDVVTMITNLVRTRDQWVTSRLDTDATLSVDRVIPLGFLLVDVASRVLRSTPGVSLTIIVQDVDDTTLEVALEADRDIAPSAPPKMFAGLVAQIEAVQVDQPEGRRLGSWRIRHVA